MYMDVLPFDEDATEDEDGLGDVSTDTTGAQMEVDAEGGHARVEGRGNNGEIVIEELGADAGYDENDPDLLVTGIHMSPRTLCSCMSCVSAYCMSLLWCLVAPVSDGLL